MNQLPKLNEFSTKEQIIQQDAGQLWEDRIVELVFEKLQFSIPRDDPRFGYFKHSLAQAFTHGSYDSHFCFENMAFVGDAVLGQVVTLWTFRYIKLLFSENNNNSNNDSNDSNDNSNSNNNPNNSNNNPNNSNNNPNNSNNNSNNVEGILSVFSPRAVPNAVKLGDSLSGIMTDIRSKIVRRTECARFLVHFDLHHLIRVGKGSEKEIYNYNVQAEVLEAILGAIIDFDPIKGYAIIKDIVEKILIPLHREKVALKIAESTHIALTTDPSKSASSYASQSILAYYCDKPLIKKERETEVSLSQQLYRTIATLEKDAIKQTVARRIELNRMIEQTPKISRLVQLLKNQSNFTLNIPHSSLVCSQWIVAGCLGVNISSQEKVLEWLFCELYLWIHLGTEPQRRLEEAIQNFASSSNSPALRLVDQWHDFRKQVFRESLQQLSSDFGFLVKSFTLLIEEKE